MTVSLCMIVRDEEKYPGQALESCQPLADEVIVVDTGSNDRTIDIARAHGAKVTHFEWVDDFSLARNFSISQASGKWILILDADEAISKQDYAAFRKLLSDPTVCWLFATRNYSNDPCLSNYKTVKGDYPEWERSYGGYFEGNRVRLFPNDPQIRFEGRVHELVEHTIHKLGKYRIQKTEIRIHHYGHTPEAKGERDERKAQLYAVTGEAKTRDDPTYWQNYFELALEFSSRRLFHQSLQNFERAAELNPGYSEIFSNMGYVLCEMGRYQEAIQALERGLYINPKDHEAYGNLGVAFIGMKNFSMATQSLTRAIQIYPEFVNGYCNLARALSRMGKMQEAVSAYDRALEIYPGYKTAKIELGILLVFLKQVDRAEELLLSGLEDEPEHPAALYNLGLLYRAKNHLGEALGVFERFLRVCQNEQLKGRVTQMCEALRNQGA